MLIDRETLRAIFAEIQKAARESVSPFTRGNKLDLSTPNKVGHLPPASGGTGTDQGAQPPLGLAPGAGYLLTSDATGAPVWLRLVAAAGITIAIDGATGTVTIGQTLTLDTLTWGGDDLIWGGGGLGFGEA